MAGKPKIVVIGAGSASFGLSVLGRLLLEPGLKGSTLCLVDTLPGGLQKIEALASRMNREWNSGFRIVCSTDRCEVLADADFVILSIAIDREKCWRRDEQIARHYGIEHYAENGGPGAFAHTARNLAVVMEIVRDIERLAPDAWLLNFTNPVPRICYAVSRYSRLKTIGICHQISFGYLMLGVILGKSLGFNIPEGFRFRWEDPDRERLSRLISSQAEARIDIHAAGLNHFTWMLGIRDRQTGEDLYPLLWRELEKADPGFEPLTCEVARIFNLFPVPGDCHMCEYLPYTHNQSRGVWKHYDIQGYDLDLASRKRDRLWEEIDGMARGKVSIDPLRDEPSERAEKVIAALVQDSHSYEQALNLPNCGYIQNLPEGAIVEVPATVGVHGPLGHAVGSLPEPVAELCRRQALLAQLSVEAAVEGDEGKALQALALDPMVDDPRVARQLLMDYLEEFREYLPQFRKNGIKS